MTKELNDNTRVFRPIIIEKIPYKLKPNELYFIDKKTGKKTLVKRKLETISEDKRNKYLRLLDWYKTKQILKLLEQDKNYEKGIETINSLAKLTLPSTYVGPLFNNNGKSYTDNLISGEGTGNTVGNVAVDLLTPFAIGGINKGILVGNRLYRIRLFSKALDNSSPKLELVPLNIGWGPKQTISVSHASDTGDILLFFPKRWDVVNEGANPHGIWFQGKLGIPRTDFTNPGKGAKAARARALFANRPVLTQGNLTLEKPMVTVGDVPNRSLLSYYADNAGADGLIYNGVYDNGYNNNLVILSFKNIIRSNGKPFGKLSFKNGVLYPGKAEELESYIWFNKGKPYATGIQGKPFTNAFIIDREATPLIKVRDSKVPIGQWDGKKGFVTNSEYVSPDPINIDKGLLFELKDGKYILNSSFISVPRGYKFTSFDLASPLKNGLWDMPTIVLQLKNGTSKARDFLLSLVRLNTYNHNKELATRLGFGNIEEPYNSIARVNKPFLPKLNVNTSSNEGGSFMPGKTALLDIIEINLVHDIEPAAFHETLHRGSYGMGSLEGLDNMTEFRNTNRFYEYLSDKLKKPWSSLPTSMRDYLDKPGELPVNVLELGLRMGIQVGLKYPGKTKFNAIIDLFKRNNPNDGKLFILDYLNMDKPKRVWDALSGLYFAALPAIYGGYKTIEN